MGKDTWPYTRYGTPHTVEQEGGYLKVVLVSGSRDWDDTTAIEGVLDFAQPDVLIHGAASGADFIADRWAKWVRGITIEPHKIPQDWWELYGKGAGPIRNEYMVARAKEYENYRHKVLVIAFPRPES